jgi:hypothetical protein
MWQPQDVDRDADVAAARRGVASFGGGGESGIAEALREFVRRYGWRAYALPILVVVSVLALLTAKDAPGKTPTASGVGHSHSAGPTNPPTAGSNMALMNDVPSGGVDPAVLSAIALPPGASYTKQGDGTFRVLKGTTKVFGTATDGKIWRYDIEVENGVTGVNLTQFASLVDATLADPRSWSGHGVSLERVDSGPVDFHITLTSSLTVRKFCGYSIPIETSCYAAAGSAAGLDVNRVVLNDARWVRGAVSYIGDLTAYREEMINHEDGHALGHMHAHECLSDGLAPTMMQQTIGLKTPTGQICEANPWPYPPGAKDAPGIEAPDTPKNDEYNLQEDN